MIELNCVTGGYHGEKQLSDISLTIPQGQITAVIGPNGCGKSTLLRLICGLMRPYSGEILLGGKPLAAYSPKDLAKTISFLPQSRPDSSIRVESLVLHGRFPYMGYPRRYREEDREAARQAMDWAGVSHLCARNVSTLSGGERQKVYIAMLLAQGTPVAVLDEPTSSLDISHKFDVIRLAQGMRDEGKTVVMVLHDLDLALKFADRVVLMEQGQIRACGTAQEVLASGEIERTFRIRPGTIETPEGTQYYFQPI